MPGPKTNERPRHHPGTKGHAPEAAGVRAVHRHARMSAFKVREVLDLIRDLPVSDAEEVLRFSERDGALLVGKVLRSAVANAENNEELDPDELYVSACFADEGTTIKRWRPRARGRATRIRKRTCHITVIVSRLPLDRLERLTARRRAEAAAQRARRVAGARKAEGDTRSRAERRRRGAAAEPETVETEPEAAAETPETTGSEPVETQPEAPETTGSETVETQPEASASEPHAGQVAAEAEEQGIVDQQAPALAAEESAEQSDQGETATDEGNE
jgi:large subunit ribosomal protein L22